MFAVILGAVCEIHASWRKRETVTQVVKAIPQAPGGLPVIGHAGQLLRDPLKFVSSLPAYGDLVGIQLGPVKVIMVCDLELTRQVLLDDHTFDVAGPLFDRVQEAIGGTMYARPEQHRRNRRLVQPAFRRERLPGYLQTISAHAFEVVGSWRDGQIVDICAEINALTVGSAMETMFSGAVTTAISQQAIADLTVVFDGFYRRAIMPPLLARLPTSSNRRYHRAITRLRETASTIIAERRASGMDQGDVLSAMLTAPAGEEGLTDNEINDLVVTFFIAGVQSTSSLLAWALHLVASHPQIQERLSAEAKTTLRGASASMEHLPGLELAAQVITETLRMYPPGWMLSRRAVTDTRLGEYPIPAGADVFYSPYLIHHRDDLYADPERFDPARWDRSIPSARQAFLAFGHGPRKCIADTLGYTEAVLTLATIISRWRLVPNSGRAVRPAKAFALRPDHLELQVMASSD